MIVLEICSCALLPACKGEGSEKFTNLIHDAINAIFYNDKIVLTFCSP